MKLCASLLIAILSLTWAPASGLACNFGCPGSSDSGACTILALAGVKAGTPEYKPALHSDSCNQGKGVSSHHCYSCPCFCHHPVIFPPNAPLPDSDFFTTVIEESAPHISLFLFDLERPPKLS